MLIHFSILLQIINFLPKIIAKFLIKELYIGILIFAFFILPIRAEMPDSLFSILESYNLTDPTLQFSPNPVSFTDKTPQQIQITLSDSSPINIGKLSDAYKTELDKYASSKLTVLNETTLVLDVTPLGNSGKFDFNFTYDKNISGKLTINFGYQNIRKTEDNGKEIINELDLNIKKPKILNITLDGHLSPSNSIKISPENKNLSVDSATAGKITVNTINLTTEPLKVVIGDFTYILFDKIKINDVLSEILLKDDTHNIPATDSTKSTSTPNIEINLPEKLQKKYEIIGRFSSGKEENLKWVENPDTSATGFSINGKEGGLLNITGVSSNGRELITYHISRLLPDEISSSIVDLEIWVTVNSVASFLQVSPIQGTNILLPNSKIQVKGELRNTSNNQLLPLDKIDYKIVDSCNQIWLDIANEGTTATIYWRNPSEEEIRLSCAKSPKRPGEIKIDAVATSSGIPDVTGQIIVRMAAIKKFSQLKVKLNIMDDQTAADLYGSVTAKEYYVLNVRLNNNLKDDDTGQPTGNSIIAYSGSMEIAVALEKKWNESKNSSDANVISKQTMGDVSNSATNNDSSNNDDASIIASYNEKIKKAREELDKINKIRDLKKKNYIDARVVYADKRDETSFQKEEVARLEYNDLVKMYDSALQSINQLKEDEFRELYSHRIKIQPEVDQNGNPLVFNDGKWHPVTKIDFKRFAPYSLIPDQDVAFSNRIAQRPMSPKELEVLRKAEADKANDKEDPPCVGTLTYRPLTFEMVVNTVDRRDERSLRSRIFKLLDTIGTGTSFITAVAVPAKSSDLPLGLEKYSNLLMPGLNKLFPSLKENHRQNIVGQTMKPIEEIPFGSDITRVVFIPKKNINGLILGHDVRISEVCPFYFKIEVAVIENSTTVQQGNNIP